MIDFQPDVQDTKASGGIDFQSDSPAPATPAATASAPAAEPSILDKANAGVNAVGHAGSEIGAGAIKGALSTVYSVPQSLARITSAVTNAVAAGNYDEGMGNLASVTTALIRKANSLPDTDPRKQSLMALAHENIAHMEGTRVEQAKSEADAKALNEKPDILQPQTGLERAGYTGEKVAEFMAPGSTVNRAEGAITKATAGLPTAARIAANVGAKAAAEGASAATVSMAQNPDISEAAKTGVTTAAISAPFKAAAEMAPLAKDYLQTSAEKKASQALGATTKANKELSDKVVPGLLSRRVTFMTRGGLDARATEEISKAGDALEEGYSKLPPDAKVTVAPLLQKLEGIKDSTIAKGTSVVIDSDKYAAAQRMQQKILEVANGNPDISVETFRSARQILDNATARTGKSFGLSGTEGANLAVQKETANTMRRILAEEYPSIDKLNKEFSFWSDVKKVVGATIDRTKSQGQGLTATIAEGAGAGGELARGGGIVKSGITGVIMGTLTKLVTSPGWKMTSAVMRSRLADSIAAGNTTNAINLMNRMLVGITNASKK